MTHHFPIYCFQVTPSELTTFANNYSSPEFFQANGLTLAGIRFIFLSGTDRVLRAKKNKSGLHCMKTEKGKFEHFWCFHNPPPLTCMALTIDYLYSYRGINLWGTNNTPASCQCSRKAGWIPHGPWILDKQRKGPAHKGSGDKTSQKWENPDKILDASDQSMEIIQHHHHYFNLIKKINFHSVC